MKAYKKHISLFHYFWSNVNHKKKVIENKLKVEPLEIRDIFCVQNDVKTNIRKSTLRKLKLCYISWKTFSNYKETLAFSEAIGQ